MKVHHGKGGVGKEGRGGYSALKGGAAIFLPEHQGGELGLERASGKLHFCCKWPKVSEGQVRGVYYAAECYSFPTSGCFLVNADAAGGVGGAAAVWGIG